MSKNWETKEHIISLLRAKHMTLTDISERLDLAPSTVSQHLKELVEMGAIKEADEQFSRKWRYYEAVEGFEIGDRESAIGRSLGYRIGPVIAVVLIAIAGVALIAHGLPSSSQYVVQLTDPPQVPMGTQALIMGYSNVELHESGMPAGSGYISANAVGSVNLMNLTNVTETIATLSVPAAARFDSVSFSITSAKVVIDNRTYDAAVPGGMITVPISAAANQTGGVIVDFAPAVLQLYNSGNSSVFAMVPSAKAVAVGRSSVSVSAYQVGVRTTLGVQNSEMLGAASNLSVLGGALVSTGNSTEVSITVKNGGRSAVILRHIIISGYMKAIVSSRNNSGMQPPANLSLSANGSVLAQDRGGIDTAVNGTVNASETALGDGMGSMDGRLPGNAAANSSASAKASETIGGILNSSENKTAEIEQIGRLVNSVLNATVIADLHDSNATAPRVSVTIHQAIVFNNMYHGNLNFLIGSNGRLFLPSSDQEVEGNFSGYTLGPGQSVTFTFSGVISPGSSRNVVEIIPNQTYGVVVGGEEGASAGTDVIASLG